MLPPQTDAAKYISSPSPLSMQHIDLQNIFGPNVHVRAGFERLMAEMLALVLRVRGARHSKGSNNAAVWANEVKSHEDLPAAHRRQL